MSHEITHVLVRLADFDGIRIAAVPRRSEIWLQVLDCEKKSARSKRTQNFPAPSDDCHLRFELTLNNRHGGVTVQYQIIHAASLSSSCLCVF